MKRILKKVLWGFFWFVLAICLVSSVWGSGGWMLDTFPEWLVRILLGLNYLFVLIVFAILVALGIIKIQEFKKEFTNDHKD